MKDKLLIVCLLASLGHLSIASARPTLDTNGDGALSLEEIQAANPEASGERFSQFDANGDGLLTGEERRQGRQGRAQQRFSETDLDGSGGLSLEEIQARNPDATGERFSRLDRDGNGEIGPGEVRAGRKAGKQHRRSQGGNAGGQRPVRGQNRGSGGRGRP